MGFLNDMANILIAGGSGLVGMALAKRLKSAGHFITLLSRSGKKIEPYDSAFSWDPQKGHLNEQALDGVDGIVNLAGAGIADKAWTNSRKQEILDSRVKSTELLLEVCRKKGLLPDVFVSASAVGWYGAVSDTLLHTENEPAANDFMGETCRKWEAAADGFEGVAQRVVKIRTGVVLDTHQGALPELMKPFRFGLGAVLGSGRQQIQWIHITDIARVFEEALFNPSFTGVYNASATENCSNREFTQTLGSVLKKPVFPMGVPSFALRLVLGEMSAVVLEGSRVSNEKLKKTGFIFSYPGLENALINLVS